jgi:transposase
VQKFRTLFVLPSICYKPRFLSRGEDQISVPERFHVSQSTLSRLRRRMLTTGSLNDHFRSGRPRVVTLRHDQETPLLHLRNRFQAAVKTAAHFRTHNNAWISPKMVMEGVL